MSELADILSIIGFIITIWTFIKVWDNTEQIKELNKKNFFINRLPDNLMDLKKSSSKISILISNIDENNYDYTVLQYARFPRDYEWRVLQIIYVKKLAITATTTDLGNRLNGKIGLCLEDLANPKDNAD
ncbi:hypothetical protein [Flavobacterium sp. CF136]|uniref:hypothetical protein n=1 Tax=Flavobacterium sp. (strain CF136) TaxID=1144313 RepID=UPI0002715AEC|nr:hypothetical protein [Flavobacterium sp. CF136]EJL64324.1 hypothetical protein PMI10_01999 [Flavobacterium sp. CF136]